MRATDEQAADRPTEPTTERPANRSTDRVSDRSIDQPKRTNARSKVALLVRGLGTRLGTLETNDSTCKLQGARGSLNNMQRTWSTRKNLVGDQEHVETSDA